MLILLDQLLIEGQLHNITVLGGNLVIRRSKKIKCGNSFKKKKTPQKKNRSSAGAELKVMAQGICELLWLKIVLQI